MATMIVVGHSLRLNAGLAAALPLWKVTDWLQPLEASELSLTCGAPSACQSCSTVGSSGLLEHG